MTVSFEMSSMAESSFIDGNKRIGTHAMLVFLDINQMTLSYEDDDLIETILRVASGTLDYNGLLDWLQKHLEEGRVFLSEKIE